jgi:hypothetical protein
LGIFLGGGGEKYGSYEGENTVRPYDNLQYEINFFHLLKRRAQYFENLLTVLFIREFTHSKHASPKYLKRLQNVFGENIFLVYPRTDYKSTERE